MQTKNNMMHGTKKKLKNMIKKKTELFFVHDQILEREMIGYLKIKYIKRII